MKKLIILITITILCLSFGSCKEVKNENVIYEDLWFTILKLDNDKVVILPKDNNNKSQPIIVSEKDYKIGKYNVSVDN